MAAHIIGPLPYWTSSSLIGHPGHAIENRPLDLKVCLPWSSRCLVCNTLGLDMLYNHQSGI